MKKLTLDYAEQARIDMVQIGDWLVDSNKSMTASNRFVSNVHMTALDLCETPGMGALFELGEFDFRGLRKKSVRGFPNHLIFYRQMGSALKIVRILHGAQDLIAVLEGEYE